MCQLVLIWPAYRTSPDTEAFLLLLQCILEMVVVKIFKILYEVLFSKRT